MEYLQKQNISNNTLQMKTTNRHYKHAKKIMTKWKGTTTKRRVNMAIDEVVVGMKESLPKYKRFYRTDGTYFVINLHEMLA